VLEVTCGRVTSPRKMSTIPMNSE